MQSGFGNYFITEAIKGALPEGQNSPQNVPHGLYAEQFSATAFTAPRAENRKAWFYRLKPTASHKPYRPFDGQNLWRSAPFNDTPPNPNRLRWNPLPFATDPKDFLDGMVTIVGNGDVAMGCGIAIHTYAITASMGNRALMNADAEMLIIPQLGRLKITTEMGVFEIAPLQIAVIPRGIRFKVDLLDTQARGYVCENYGALFRLPELGPIGANGLANPRDFESPVAAFEDNDEPHELIQKFQGSFWVTDLDHSPFDVVAWHGNLAPYRYDLRRFNVMNTVSFDHPDPSIFTVLTSPSAVAGTANCDFVIFPPRWMVAEHTFRPPWYHRNIMSEFMGLIEGDYDAKSGGFVPGGASLHNQMSSHGPDQASYEAAINADLKPQRMKDTMAFMLESVLVMRPTHWAMQKPQLQDDYDGCWDGLKKAAL